jgi:hypothetical protein
MTQNFVEKLKPEIASEGLDQDETFFLQSSFDKSCLSNKKCFTV